MRTTPNGTVCTWCEEVARLMVSVTQKDEMPQLRDSAIRRAVQEDRGIVRKVPAGDIHLMETMCEFLTAHNMEGGHDALWGDVLSRSEVKTTGAEKLIAKWAGMELVFSVSLTAEIARIGIENIKKGLQEIVNSATHTRHAAIERLSEKIAPMRMEAAFAALFRIWSTADTYSTFPRNYESLGRFWTGSLITDLRNTKWCAKKWTVFLEKTADDLSLCGSKIRMLMTTTELRNRINDVTNQYLRGKRPADETHAQTIVTKRVARCGQEVTGSIEIAVCNLPRNCLCSAGAGDVIAKPVETAGLASCVPAWVLRTHVLGVDRGTDAIQQ